MKPNPINQPNPHGTFELNSVFQKTSWHPQKDKINKILTPLFAKYDIDIDKSFRTFEKMQKFIIENNTNSFNDLSDEMLMQIGRVNIMDEQKHKKSFHHMKEIIDFVNAVFR